MGETQVKVITTSWTQSKSEPSKVPLLCPRPPVRAWVYSGSGRIILETSSTPPAGPTLRASNCYYLITLSPFHRWEN